MIWMNCHMMVVMIVIINVDNIVNYVSKVYVMINVNMDIMNLIMNVIQYVEMES